MPVQSNASLSKTAKIGTAGDRRTLELPPSLDAPSERIRGQASKHSRRGKAVRVAQRKGPETSRSLKKKRGRQGQGRVGGDVGGRQEGTISWGDRGAGSQLSQGRNCQDTSPGDLNSLRARGRNMTTSMRGNTCVSKGSPPTSGARPRGRGRPQLGTPNPVASPKTAKK